MSAVVEIKEIKLTIQELLARGLVHQAVDLGIAAGYGGHVTVGAFSTGVAPGAAAILDIDRPAFILSVGGNQALIPVRFDIQAEMPAYTTDNDEVEILIAVDRTSGVAGVSGNATQEEVFNMRTDLGSSEVGSVQAWSNASSEITAPTLGMELARQTETVV